MAKKKIPKTNAARILDRLGISYELLTYPVDESDLSAAHVAEVTGIPLERIYKTLVVRGDRTGVFMAVIPGACELDLKAAAATSGNKRAEMVHLKEVFDLTGYVRGGCSPLGAKKPYPVCCDERILQHDSICVSAGRRGEQLALAPCELVRAANATTAKLVR